MKGGIAGLMQQAQKMQQDLQEAQAKLAKETVVGESGGGMVKVTMNGAHAVTRVEIDESLMGDDKEMLEDLLAAAVNAANARVAEKMTADMGQLTAGLQLPPGFKLPF